MRRTALWLFLTLYDHYEETPLKWQKNSVTVTATEVITYVLGKFAPVMHATSNWPQLWRTLLQAVPARPSELCASFLTLELDSQEKKGTASSQSFSKKACGWCNLGF